MHGNVPLAPESATECTDQSPAQSVSDENEWFVSIMRGLFQKDAGLALHFITGFEERTCYRYAAGDRKTPGYFIRQLLRSEQGSQFLSALMHGSTAQWWQDLEGARQIASQFTIKPK